MARPKRFLFFGSYLFLVVVFFELVLQGFYYMTAGAPLWARVGIPIYEREANAGFRNRPNLAIEHNTNEFRTKVFTNSEGFRTSAAREEYELNKDPKSFRIMLLGPSFAFGWGVNYEETFLFHLGNMLNAAGYAKGREIEVINTGVPALPPTAQLRWYERRGRQYQPDLVMQFIYGTVAQSGHQEFDVDARGYLVSKGADTTTRLRSLFKRSAIVFYSWVIFSRFNELLRSDVSNTNIQGAGRAMTLHQKFDANAPDERASMVFYNRLRDAVEGTKATLLVVYIPLSYVVHRADLSRWRHLGVFDVNAQVRFDKDFCEYLTQAGIQCVNLTPTFMDSAERGNERLYYWLDVHWTPAGNSLAAQAVTRSLTENRKLAPSSTITQ